MEENSPTDETQVMEAEYPTQEDQQSVLWNGSDPGAVAGYEPDYTPQPQPGSHFVPAVSSPSMTVQVNSWSEQTVQGSSAGDSAYLVETQTAQQWGNQPIEPPSSSSWNSRPVHAADGDGQQPIVYYSPAVMGQANMSWNEQGEIISTVPQSMGPQGNETSNQNQTVRQSEAYECNQVDYNVSYSPSVQYISGENSPAAIGGIVQQFNSAATPIQSSSGVAPYGQNLAPSYQFIPSVSHNSSMPSGSNVINTSPVPSSSLMGNMKKKFMGAIQATSSATDAAWRDMNLKRRAISGGGMDDLYKQLFQTYPNEQLKKKFVCHLSTIAGAVPGALFLSTFHASFCSDNQLSTDEQGEKNSLAYYKVMIPLTAILSINSVIMKENSSEKYIQISTSDGQEIWFLKFHYYDKALLHLSRSISQLATSPSSTCQYGNPGYSAPSTTMQYGAHGGPFQQGGPVMNVSDNGAPSIWQHGGPGNPAASVPLYGAHGGPFQQGGPVMNVSDNGAPSIWQHGGPGNPAASVPLYGAHGTTATLYGSTGSGQYGAPA